jgi:hypothetical protein
MTLSSRLVLLTAGVAVRRANRERRRVLERELAAYSSAADLADISAMVERYPDAQTGEVRSILAWQSMRRPAPWGPVVRESPFG